MSVFTAAYPRTDLACETRPRELPPIPGVRAEESVEEGVSLSDLTILDDEAARLMGKPIGRYVTLSRAKLWQLSGQDYDHFRDRLAEKLLCLAIEMTGRRPDPKFGVLIAGLGNRDITPDATARRQCRSWPSRAICVPLMPAAYTAIGRCALSALAPGVLGQTGIETVELIRGAVENAEPDLVIAVDALVAAPANGWQQPYQLCNRGIDPGSGIGNNRKSICRDTVGAPVMALGVPTVVDSSTLVYDALNRAGIDEISDDLRAVLENGRGFFVSPKESDVITTHISTLLADAIEHAFTIVE